MNHSLRLSFAIKRAEQKVFRRLQCFEIQITHSGAGIIFSWDARGLQGEAFCCSLPKISSFSVQFTQLRDIKACGASERHWSKTWLHHRPGGICPGRTAFCSHHFPSAVSNLQRTVAAWKFDRAPMSSGASIRGKGQDGGAEQPWPG